MDLIQQLTATQFIMELCSIKRQEVKAVFNRIINNERNGLEIQVKSLMLLMLHP